MFSFLPFFSHFHSPGNGAVVFVDYEYWYVSMKKNYHVSPDIQAWARGLREKYEVQEIYFFANFTQEPFKGEVVRIREVTNHIIETQSSYNGSYIKDMADFIILDFIYREVSKKRSPRHFILFTGDGHFQPVVRHLVQDKKKTVVVYGIHETISRVLRETCDSCVELPDMEEERNLCRRLIVEDFDRIAAKNVEVIVTFRSMASRIATYHRVPQQSVEIALSEMLEEGLLTKKKHRAAFGENLINIIMPEWDKLIEAGLYELEK